MHNAIGRTTIADRPRTSRVVPRRARVNNAWDGAGHVASPSRVVEVVSVAAAAAAAALPAVLRRGWVDGAGGTARSSSE